MLDIGSYSMQSVVMEPSRKPATHDKDGHDLELHTKVKRVTDKFSECIHIVANEPSLGLFRIQEHVRKTLPQLAHTKVELAQLQQKVQGSCYDVDYAINAMESLKESKRPLSNMETMLKSAIITKKHLNDKVTDRWVILDPAPNLGVLVSGSEQRLPPPSKDSVK
ncbi:BLOC-1-related complex subunit 8-like isoform X2 [Apostichopus japonicus]|uniref:BLOC-1-related complex subunit 8-like isoform X2 n=1 Tax=Stichopus japonicus TaxID=307972 RepID=UPI003AB6A20F